MGRPQQVTDEQIDNAARAIFIEHGPGAPVSLVAEQLGVSHAALLQRAGSKEQLLLRALRPGAPEVQEQLEAPPPPRDQAGRLSELLGDLLRFHQSMLPGLVMLRAGGLSSDLPRSAEPPTLALRRLLATWLGGTGKVGRGRAGVLADALLGTIEARCFNAYLGGKRFVAGRDVQFVRELVSVLIPELSHATTKGRDT